MAVPHGQPVRDLPARAVANGVETTPSMSLEGTYDKMFAQVAAVFGFDADIAEDIQKLLSVDSTSVRAHQHAVGARLDTLAAGGTVELQESCR
jgi:hypothetical protein